MSVLTAPQLANAAVRFVADFDPRRLPRTDLAAAFTAFLTPLTTEHLKPADVTALIETANSYHEARELSADFMESAPGAWAKHANRAHARLTTIATHIVNGENIG